MRLICCYALLLSSLLLFAKNSLAAAALLPYPAAIEQTEDFNLLHNYDEELKAKKSEPKDS